MKMYSIVRTRRNTNNGHRYLTDFCRFRSFSEMEREDKRPNLYCRREAVNRCKALRKWDRKHNFRTVLADNV